MWDRKKDRRVVVNVKLLVSLATTKEKCLVCAALLFVLVVVVGLKLA
jgi:hypothetical protein